MIAAATSVGFGAEAIAHEGGGKIQVLAADSIGPLEVAYRLRLTFVSDGHPAGDATVNSVTIGADGRETAAQPLPHGDGPGVYAGTIRFSGAGAWTVRFSAVTPTATLDRAENIAEPPTTTTTTITVAPTGTTGSPSPGGQGGGAVRIGLVVASGVAVLGGGAFAASRRRRQ